LAGERHGGGLVDSPRRWAFRKEARRVQISEKKGGQGLFEQVGNRHIKTGDGFGLQSVIFTKVSHLLHRTPVIFKTSTFFSVGEIN
jgi:hypothetical protein